MLSSWQQLPGLPAQQAAAAALPRPQLVTDTLGSQVLPDNWRRSLVVDNLDGTTVLPMVGFYHS